MRSRKRYGERDADPYAVWPDDRIYGAWVMTGAHAMIGTAEEYIRQGRPIDQAFVATAAGIIRQTNGRFEQAGS